ncbi:pilus assembly protein [Aureimonas flava]|uniref:Pilus assembly protein n=1 Tax=Aureimonas flava TaxID=2320271 RepID=A0A3A1WGN1_9HYPH|nr:TadE/TadG family type IV pilus assembly protein [Aureimonas flava]RIX97560.1 pilus assembly protein [Aureimonas flava]
MSGISPFRRLARDRRGIAAIEFALIAPVLIALLLGTVTLFGLYRDSATAEKSTFTIGDILSRKTETTTADLDVNRAIFVAMAGHPVGETTFRVSSVMRKSGKFVVCWSYAPSPMVAMTDATIPTADMPVVADSDSVIFVETTVQSTPLFNTVGLPVTTLSNFSAARPRFSAALKNTSMTSAPC